MLYLKIDYPMIPIGIIFIIIEYFTEHLLLSYFRQGFKKNLPIIDTVYYFLYLIKIMGIGLMYSDVYSFRYSYGYQVIFIVAFMVNQIY